MFYTALGDQVVFPASLVFDQPYWLGIQVGIEAELSTRIPLTSVGYSFSALRADTASYATRADTAEYAFSGVADNITTDQLADNAVTSAKIADGTITGADINVDAYLAVEGIYAQMDGGGAAGEFQITNASNNAIALSAITAGINRAGYIEISNLSSPATALEVYTSGPGRAAEFIVDNGNSSFPAIEVYTSGTGYAGYFHGDVYTTGSYQGSDSRWKQNIAPLAGALNKVLALRGVQFEWNRADYPDKGFREGIQIGLIAQEVEEVLPELVRDDQDGYKAVEYQKITAVLVEAMKEQQHEIEALKAAVAALQGQSDMALGK